MPLCFSYHPTVKMCRVDVTRNRRVQVTTSRNSATGKTVNTAFAAAGSVWAVRWVEVYD